MKSDVPPLIPVSNVGVTAAKLMLTLKINAKPNNNSADKSNFCLILPPPGIEIQLNNTLLLLNYCGGYIKTSILFVKIG